MASLKGKVAVVTGASRGIGRAIAERLARDGASVVVNYARSSNEATDVIAAINSRSGKSIAIQADIGRAEEVRRLFRETIAQLHRVDILVNNAATFVFKLLADTTEEEFAGRRRYRIWSFNGRPWAALGSRRI